MYTQKIPLALNELPMEKYQKLAMLIKFGANVDDHPSIVHLSNVVGLQYALNYFILL